MSPVLEVTGLKKAYGAIKAVDGVSFSVMPGEIFGVIGPNGSGKTTMFNSVLGQIEPDEGRIELNGRDAWVLATKLGNAMSERVNARLKDEFGGRTLRVRGAANITRWLPFEISPAEVRNRLRNKMIRPTTIPQTLEELSQVYDVSRERIRQIEVRAFEKLQKAMQRIAGERLLPGVA